MKKKKTCKLEGLAGVYQKSLTIKMVNPLAKDKAIIFTEKIFQKLMA